MNYLLYDLEIANCIPDRKQPLNPKYKYCKGWHDHENMGISVAGFIDQDGVPLTIAPEVGKEKEELQWFEEIAMGGDVKILGFNSLGFDDMLMAAHGIFVTTDYDILLEIRRAAFGSTRWQDTPKGYSYSLGVLGEANGFPKTGSGAIAPQLWQDGERQSVIEYCANDVKITRELLLLGLAGELVDPNTGKKLQLAPLG